MNADDGAAAEEPRAPRSGVRRALPVVLVTALAVIGAIIVYLAVAGDGSETSASPAERVPQTTFERFDGSTGSFADYRGRPLVVNFWAAWCAPCIHEMPRFEEVHQELGDRVAFLGINTRDNPDSAANIVEETGVTYDLARDPEGELFRSFEVRAMPNTVFVAPDGEILGAHAGAMSRDALEERIRELLLPA